MNKIKIGVIIPTYRRSYELNKCISSLGRGASNEYTIIVINDGSDEGVSNLLRLSYPNIVEISSTYDLWWTKAINLGLKYLVNHKFEAAIILNDDVEVEREFLENMISWHRLNPADIIVSKIVDQVGNLWAMGGYASWPFAGERHIKSMFSNEKITWSPGMGTLIPLRIVNCIGYLDEKNMPQYLSDVDFGLRATNANIKIIANDSSVVRNNTLTTGGISAKNNLGLKDLKFILFDLRSSDYFKARSVFIFRHAPFGLRTISLVYRLSSILIYFIKRLL